VETHLLIHTDRAIRRSLAAWRPGRTVFASDEITAEDRATYDDVVKLPPVRDVEGTLSALERIPADRVFFQTEFGLLAGSLLAARRGLPGPSPEAAHLGVNKWACREALRLAGVPQPRCVRCRTAADVRRADLGFPLVLKAAASTLGRLVTKVERPEDLDAAVERLLARLPGSSDVARLVAFGKAAGIPLGLDPTAEFLAETFAPGRPLEADGLVFGREIDLFGVTEQVVRDGDGFFLEAYLFPADEPGRAGEVSRRAIEAIGLSDSGFSIELRGDEVIEVNARLGEDDGFPDLFRTALGAFPLERWWTGATRGRPPRGRHALAYVNRYRGGTFEGADSIPEGVVVTVSPGAKLFDTGDPRHRAHLAFTIASHPASSRAALVVAQDRLRRLALRVSDAEAPPCRTLGPAEPPR
jgi:hypothetical protein